jgi:hypothetical protein
MCFLSGEPTNNGTRLKIFVCFIHSFFARGVRLGHQMVTLGCAGQVAYTRIRWLQFRKGFKMFCLLPLERKKYWSFHWLKIRF